MVSEWFIQSRQTYEDSSDEESEESENKISHKTATEAFDTCINYCINYLEQQPDTESGVRILSTEFNSTRIGCRKRILNNYIAYNIVHAYFGNEGMIS